MPALLLTRHFIDDGGKNELSPCNESITTTEQQLTPKVDY